MAQFAIKASKGGAKNVPRPPEHASFVLGSRPGGIRAPSVPRIKPALGQTQYGKKQPDTTGASFGNTGQTSLS